VAFTIVTYLTYTIELNNWLKTTLEAENLYN